MTTPPVTIQDSFGFLERAIEASMLRHKAIQTNIANTTTPGFKRFEVEFESLIRDDADANAISRTEPNVVRDRSQGRSDGNNVEFEREYADLEKNRMHFEAIAELVNLRIQGLRQVIQSK